MAVRDPKAKTVTLFYSGGSVSATRGLIDFIFPGWAPSWLANGESGTGRRPFGSRQRNSRAVGEKLVLALRDGSKWAVRITGTHKAFLQQVLGQNATAEVVGVYSERGATYGPDTGTLNPAP